MKQIIDDRRALHRIPELDRALDQTLGYLRRALGGLRCALFAPIPNSLCAYFDNGRAQTLAFRAGCDALPVHERSFLPFASEIPGRMHACGHDGHMAMLLELARRMDAQRAAHNVLLVFQPAEETTGGARDICKSGVFEAYAVSAIFGLHLWPDLPLGVIASRKNEMMSRSCEVTVDLYGRSCSVARPEAGIDALRAGVDFYLRAEQAERDWPREVHRLLRFGKLESGCMCNVLSDHTRLEGTLRAFRDEVFFGILDALNRAAREVSARYGVRAQIETSMGYPAVMNPPALFERVLASGISFETLDAPVLITEDFSWYQQHLPGLFFFLGAGPAPALQADDFNFDESALETGADFLETLALKLKD